mgnify:CR=1 FL=1
MSNDFSPREIVSELDKHIVGQLDAKRAVAVALRNRWRRLQLPEALREEVLRECEDELRVLRRELLRLHRDCLDSLLRQCNMGLEWLR